LIIDDFLWVRVSNEPQTFSLSKSQYQPVRWYQNKPIMTETSITTATKVKSLPSWSRTQSSKRAICEQCQRPTPKACICEALPVHRIPLHRTRIFVLQHPHESRRKNRSLPILQLTLTEESLHVMVGRRLGGMFPKEEEEEEYQSFQRILKDTSTRLFLLYPSPDAIPLEDAIQMVHSDIKKKYDKDSSHQKNIMVNLLVLDGTWQYTREMDRASVYPDHMIRIQWTPKKDLQMETYNPRFAIRKPPSPNCLSTAECIAHVVSQLEDDDDDDGPSLFDQLMKPLDWMVTKWKSFQKTGKHNRTEENQHVSDSPPTKKQQQEKEP
jgi:DTW domain-containing protein YfiP